MTQARSARSSDSFGVALSGGGHRATLLGLGALLYLADAGKGGDVRTIASVSAGSITNAYLASLKESPLVAGETFAPHVAHLAHKIAGDRRWWVWSWVLVALIALWFVAILVRAPLTDDWLVRLAMPLAALVAVALFAGWRSGGSLWASRGTWLWLVLVAASLVPGVYLWRTAEGAWSRVGAVLVGVFVTGVAVFLRGHALRWSLSRTIAPLGSRRTNRARLEDMNPQIEHVICATELHAGTHAYFGRDFIYAREFGFGEPAGLPISTALHASASFPLVFPVCLLRAIPHGFRFPDVERKRRKVMVLSDGGIFDNMADAWQLESPDRVRRLAHRNRVQRDSNVNAFIDRLKAGPTTLIVVDAGPPPGSKSIAAALIPGITELFGVARAAAVSHSSALLTRSRDLYARFEAQNPQGAVIASAMSPLDVIKAVLDPERVEPAPADAIRRAKRAHAYLSTQYPREQFAEFPALSMAGGTYLTPVGVERTAHILLHGYVQAMITLHISLGYPLLDHTRVRDDFRRMTAGLAPATPAGRALSAAAM